LYVEEQTIRVFGSGVAQSVRRRLPRVNFNKIISSIKKCFLVDNIGRTQRWGALDPFRRVK
jgi:hypothetical protein